MPARQHALLAPQLLPPLVSSCSLKCSRRSSGCTCACHNRNWARLEVWELVQDLRLAAQAGAADDGALGQRPQAVCHRAYEYIPHVLPRQVAWQHRTWSQVCWHILQEQKEATSECPAAISSCKGFLKAFCQEIPAPLPYPLPPTCTGCCQSRFSDMLLPSRPATRTCMVTQLTGWNSKPGPTAFRVQSRTRTPYSPLRTCLQTLRNPNLAGEVW